MAGTIHIGIGGWDFDPWRGTFYPAGLAKDEAARASRHAAQRDRDQRHLLQDAVARAVRALGEDGARRLQVRDQGVALLHQPQEARRGRGIDRQVLRARASPSSATSWARSCGSSRRPRGSTPDELRAFLMLLPTSRDGIALRHALEVRHESFKCREFVAHGARGERRDRLRRSRHLSRDRRPDRGLRLCPAAADPRGGAGGLWRGGARPLGGGRARLGGRRRARRGSIMSATPGPRRRRARSSSSSSAAPRCAIPLAAEALAGRLA